MRRPVRTVSDDDDDDNQQVPQRGQRGQQVAEDTDDEENTTQTQEDDDDDDGDNTAQGADDGDDDDNDNTAAQGDDDDDNPAATTDDDDVAPTRQTVTRTASDPITQEEKDDADDKAFPPIKVFHSDGETLISMSATLDTGCQDDWLTLEKLRSLGWDEDDLDPPSPSDNFNTFNGQSMTPLGTINVQWHGESNGRSSTNTFLVAEEGEFDILFGRDFLFEQDGFTYFQGNVEVLAAKKSSKADTDAMQTAHDASTAKSKTTAAQRSQQQRAKREQERQQRTRKPAQNDDDDDDDQVLAGRTARVSVRGGTQDDDDD
ncbi:hypothetical protein MMC20_000599 [Loxospora ochrophaea]|nr:hypothetical protein [Loxospora ochrophaea]